MKIHLEFNNVGEMVSYSKFILNTVTIPETNNQAKSQQIETLQAQLDKATANLERAYARLRMADPEGKTVNKTERQFKAEKEGVKLFPLHMLKAGRRAFNCLKGNVEYVQDLEDMTEVDLLMLPGMGKITLQKIKDQLQKQYKISLKELR